MLVFSSVTALTIILIVSAVGIALAGTWARQKVRHYLERRAEEKRIARAAQEHEERLIEDLLREEFTARHNTKTKQP